MAPPTGHTNISATLGDVSGQVAVGDYNVQIHAEHGAIVNYTAPGNKPRASPRPVPVRLRPRAVTDFLDRKTETETILSAVATVTPVQIHGPAGAGKTTLLKYLAYQPDLERLPGGVVSLSALNQPAEDLLQSLFEAFYECDQPFKPSDAQLRHYFSNTQAAILLDDVGLPREQIGVLVNLAPACAFVLASVEQSLWGEGKAVPVRGLPADDSLALIERELGRALTEGEVNDARAIAVALDGQPLEIIRAVADVAQGRRRLSDAAAALGVAQAPDRRDAAATESAQAIASLGETDRRIVSVAAILEGESVSANHLAAMADVPNIQTALELLVKRGWLKREDDRYSIVGDPAAIASQLGDLTQLRNSVLAHFASWAEGAAANPQAVMKHSGAILKAMSFGAATGRAQEVRRLGRAVDEALAVSGHWGAWAQSLENVLRTSTTANSTADTAWALHQLGSRALCLGDKSTAKSYLTQALEMRRSIGDAVGAQVTEHNLEMLVAPPPAHGPGHSEHFENPPWRRLSRFFIPTIFLLLSAFGVWSMLPPALPSINPHKIGFGSRVVGQRGELQRITISNPNWRSATVERPTIEGPNAGDFSVIDNNCTEQIGAGRECFITVAFVPSSAGERAAALVIAGATKEANGIVVSLTGVGMLPPSSGISVAPGELTFAAQTANTPTEPQSILITNVGTQPFTLGQPALTGSGASSFKIAGCDRTSIPAGEFCKVEVTFTPPSAGSYAATLVIADSSGKVLHDRVLLTGLLKESDQPANPNPTAPILEVRPDAVDFGTVETGSTSQSPQISIVNRGTGPLRISRIAIVDGHTDDFVPDSRNCAQALVAPGASCSISVQFKPNGAGSHAATLRIEDQSNALARNVLLRGAAVAALMGVEPSRLDFGQHKLREKGQHQSVTVRNLGLAPMRITSISGDAGAPFQVNKGCEEKVVPPSGQCSFDVVFLTRSAGKFSGSVTVTSDAMNGKQTVPLSGEVLSPPSRPEISLSPDSIDFDTVQVGKGRTIPISVVNVGSAPLRVASVTLGRTPGDFHFSTNCDRSLIQPNASCSIEVTFAPSTTGSSSESLVISDNTERGETIVKVTGVGVDSKGWCCAGKKIFQASKAECGKQDGSFFDNEAQAKRACAPQSNGNQADPIGICCIDGERTRLTESECRGRGGSFFSNLRLAVINCRKKQPENGWCCVKGDVIPAANKEDCVNRKGLFFRDKADAENRCKVMRNPGGTIR